MMGPSKFSDDLLAWWRSNRRSFPWRDDRDPYHILIAEFLLHRTRAENVTRVYEEFLKVYPDVRKLSESRLSDVLRITGTLGLRWRIKYLVDAAVIIEKEMGGVVPFDKDALLSLPGVGEYIASAVRVFSGGFSDPLIDTNTIRIISRLYGEPYGESSRRDAELRDRYIRLMGSSPPDEFGFGLIDLASEICRPINPRCKECPVKGYCMTGAKLTGKD